MLLGKKDGTPNLELRTPMTDPWDERYIYTPENEGIRTLKRDHLKKNFHLNQASIFRGYSLVFKVYLQFAEFLL